MKVSGPLTSVSVPTAGVSVAKLTTAIRAEVETRAQARRTRGLKMPDSEAGFVRMILLINSGLEQETAAPDEYK